MASKEQAEQVVKWVRGKYGQDLGADNKRYVDPPVLLLKDEQAETRNANQSLASIRRALLRTELRERRAGGGVFDTPAKIGQLIFNQKLFAGNCGEMCYLSCFMAQRSNARIWMVTIDDPGDHQFCILGDAKPTAKSIAARTRNAMARRSRLSPLGPPPAQPLRLRRASGHACK